MSMPLLQKIDHDKEVKITTKVQKCAREAIRQLQTPAQQTETKRGGEGSYWRAKRVSAADIGAPAGIWTRVGGFLPVLRTRGRYTWPDYTTGAYVDRAGFEPATSAVRGRHSFHWTTGPLTFGNISLIKHFERSKPNRLPTKICQG